MAPTFLKSTFPPKPISHFSHPWPLLGSVQLRGCSFRLAYPSTIAGLRGDGCFFRLGFEKLRGHVVRRGAAVGSVGNGSAGGLGGGGSSGGGGGGSGGGGGGSGGGGEEDRAKRVSFLSWYMKALDEHTVLTKSVTSAFLNLVGDLICQVLINKVEVLDIRRLSVITFLGFMLVGPTLHFWYYSLSKLVSLPGTAGTVLRLFLDQFLFSPTFIGVFLSSLVTLEGKPSLVIPKLQQEWLPAVMANWQLWIPFQFLNFQFVPQQLQVLAANVVALAWNVILSFMAHRDIAKK